MANRRAPKDSTKLLARARNAWRKHPDIDQKISASFRGDRTPPERHSAKVNDIRHICLYYFPDNPWTFTDGWTEVALPHGRFIIGCQSMDPSLHAIVTGPDKYTSTIWSDTLSPPDPYDDWDPDPYDDWDPDPEEPPKKPIDAIRWTYDSIKKGLAVLRNESRIG